MEEGRTPAAVGVLSVQAPAQARSENFPVALRLLPRRTREGLLAVYGFARLVDDLGDEAPGDRLALLDWVEAELDRAYAGTATDPVLVRLAPLLRDGGLPDEALRRLIEANRRDQRVDRYPTWGELRDSCSYSADPVGHLVLAVFGVQRPDRTAWSDDVCTGLQLVEHLQDVAEDLGRGRLYLPLEDLARFGCDERTVVADVGAGHSSPALRSVVGFEAERARTLLGAAVPLARSLRGSARLAIAAFAAGGLAALDAIDRAHHDVIAHACRPSRRRVVRHAVRVLVGRRW